MKTAEAVIHEFVEANRKTLPTPYYLIDETALKANMEKMARLRQRSGAKCVLALKCFSTWSVFDLMKPYMDGTTSSSLYEARLGYEHFGKETHAYSVAWSDTDIESVKTFASKVIFNSISQLDRYAARVKPLPIGLRVNPGISHSGFDLADPARRYCRLGVADHAEVMRVSDKISGVMFHCNCENNDFKKFRTMLDRIGKNYGPLLEKLDWVSLGGGIYFTQEGYPLDDFAQLLKDFSERYNVQVYLEPGESAITRTGYLVTRVLDIVKNEIDIAIVDAAVETHMLDLLIYQSEAKVELPAGGKFRYNVTGRTCLAGDVFGTYNFPKKLEIGSPVVFSDAAGYTMVKKNWFNGIVMPSIVIRRLNGRADCVKKFQYEDFAGSLS